ncbi:MAG: hypothetical protein NUV76_12440 [Candidatus Kuenenia sp.]|nr:hypothetical protein [Candidatus Kuenenia sp.]
MANAGESQSVKVGDTVTLAGDGTDANGDALSYRWILSSLPEGSLSEIADSTSNVTTFIPDRAGTYVAQLVVSVRNGTVVVNALFISNRVANNLYDHLI